MKHMNDTRVTTEMVLARMENSLLNIEQTSFDAINVTDRIVSLLNEGRSVAVALESEDIEEQQAAVDKIQMVMDNLLEVAFTVNNVAHDLEKEAVYQQETTQSIKQIIDFLYAMGEA